jgi:hypothetical protein
MAAQSGLFVRNLTEKLFTYALGRGLERSDRAAVEAIIARLQKDGFRMSALIDGIVMSQPFQMRGKNAD